MTIKTRELSVPLTPAHAATPSRASDYFTLTKPRITLMVLVTTAVGFYLGSPPPFSWTLLASTLLGTALISGGSCALNMWWERERDARMNRTRKRPLPAGRLSQLEVLVTGLALCLIGLAWLAGTVNLLASFLGSLAIVTYVVLYTPLKPHTSWCTLVGAVSGAIPPLIGWAAVRDEVTAVPLTLFAIMFLWQLPHFLALAWMYREDYARGGFIMLPLPDPTGSRTVRQMTLYSVALLPVSLLPTWLGASGLLYLVAALLLSGGFVALNLLFSVKRAPALARAVFLASLLYLPLLFTLLVVDKT
ncbi:MAG: heme o synthase [Candidatus Xenobia bacterium]